MNIFTKVDPKTGFCVIGFIDVDLTAAQTLYGALPPQSRFVPSRAYVLSKSVASLSNGANVALSERQATTVVSAVAASLQTNLAGANNDLTFTARTAGTGGNSITVAYVDPGANNATLSVVDVGNAITVNLATGGGGAITSTAASIAAAIAADASTSNLVSVANKSGNDGTGVVIALTATALASGAEAVSYTEGQSVVDAVDLADTDANDTVQALTLAHTKALKPESLLKLVITAATATTDLASIFVEGTAVDL